MTYGYSPQLHNCSPLAMAGQQGKTVHLGEAVTRVRRDHPAHWLLGAGWSAQLPINRVQTAEETSMESVRLRDSVRWSLDCVALQASRGTPAPNKGDGNV